MKDIQIRVKSEQSIGKIKKINGGNLAPPIYNEKAGGDIRKPFSELNLALTRLHDSPLENPALPLVDVPQIFPLFHADETDPRNYRFRPTDDYIRNCVEGGTPVYYRLGISIEHGRNKYFTEPPTDVMKWVNICDRIIRHYTEGWNMGFNFRIVYWEIWNEPECGDGDGLHLMWAGSLDEYNAFYVQVAAELKKRFPHLKFGGPAHCGFSALSESFVKFCAEHHAPLDFYSYHCYAAEPDGWIVETPAMARALLDKYGYRDTEIHLNEWHYFPANWTKLRSDSDYKDRMYAEMRGLDSAAFLSSVLTRWQDTPLDMGCYYTATATAWGLFSPHGNTPTKSYYGMKAFGAIVRYPERLEADSSEKASVVLAGRGETGERALLISSFKTGPAEFHVEFDSVPNPPSVEVLDEAHNLEKADFRLDGNTLTLKTDSDSSVILIHF